jgi:hypothetical protein
MDRVRGFLAFWYDFIVGDDWVLAVGVLVALAITALAAGSSLGADAWVLLPLLGIIVLAISLWRAAHVSRS